MDAQALLARTVSLGRLHAALAAASGGLRVVLCRGEAGSGRSHLLSGFAAAASDRGAEVVWLAPDAGPQARPFGAWQELAGPVPNRAEATDLAARAAAQLPAPRGESVLLIVDDADRLDDGSLRVLTELLRLVARRRLLICLVEDETPTRSAWTGVRRTLVRDWSAELVAVEPLDARDTARLLAACGAPALPDERVREVRRVTGGNVLFLVELARELVVDPATPLPSRLSDLVERRLGTLPASARRLAAAAACAGAEVAPATLARALDLPLAVSLDALREAERGGVLQHRADGRATFAHPLLRSAVEAGLPAAERADLHRRLAEVLGGDPLGGEDALRAALFHWTAAAEAGDAAPAYAWARQAGEAALAAGAPVQAEQLLDFALLHADQLGEADRARLLLRRAAAHAAAGRAAEAHADAATAVSTARRLGLFGLLAEAALALEPVGEAAWDGDLRDWCAAALQGGHDDPTRARLLARLSQAATYLERPEEADRVSAEALRLVHGVPDRPDVLIEVLTARQLARTGPEDRAELADLAERMIAVGQTTGRPEVELRGRTWLVDALWYAGALSAIAGETAALRRCAERAGTALARWHVLCIRAQLALARAEFAEADRLIEQAWATLRELDHPAAHGFWVAMQVQAGHHRGFGDTLDDPAVWDFGDDPRWDWFGRLARASVLVDRGRLAEAAASYRRCGDVAAWGLSAGRLVLWSLAARVAAALGVRTDLVRLREWLDPYRGLFAVAGGGGTNFAGPVELAIGRCAAALGDRDAAAADLTEAARRSREVGAAGAAVECETELAAVLAGADPATAASLITETLPIARALGMTPWVERLEALKVRVSDPLSAREREVAALVAEGLGNRAIAERLGIAERTAQNHVQHILDKLGMANRAQVAAWAARRAPG